MPSILFPRHISWKVFFKNSDPFSPFGKETTRQINKTIDLLNEHQYSFISGDVDDAYLDTFIPVYENFISSKERGKIFPIRDRVTQGKLKGKIYKSISLYSKNKTFLGGFIFSHNPSLKEFASNFKVFPHSIPEHKKINIGLAADMLLCEQAIALGYDKITYGMDRNVYGYHANIGLAAYKTQIGGRPFLPSYNAVGEVNDIFDTVPVYSEDMLIFLGGKGEQFATEALFVSEQPEEELKKKFPILFSNDYFTTKIVPHTDIPTNPEWK